MGGRKKKICTKRNLRRKGDRATDYVKKIYRLRNDGPEARERLSKRGGRKRAGEERDT